MRSRVMEWLGDAEPFDVLIVNVWIVAAAFGFAQGYVFDGLLSATCAAAWGTVTHLKVERRRCPVSHSPAPPTSVAMVEPSSDMRQWARAFVEIRTALINEGNTPEEATGIVTDLQMKMWKEGPS